MQIPWEALVTLAIWIIGSTFYFIWWMATLSEKVSNIIEQVEKLSASGFAKKEDVDKEFGKIQKDVDAAHRRIDEMQRDHKAA